MSAYQPSPVPGFQPTPEQHHHEPYRPDHSSPDSYKEHDQAPYYAEQNPGLEVVPPSGPEWVAGGAENTSGTTQPWYKRKLILGIIAAVVVVAIALGVGLGVGLSSSKDKDSSKDDDGKGAANNDKSDEKPPDCKDTLCSRILSMPVFEEALYIFARTSDNHIQYRSYNGSSWEDWFDLGETTGNFISQPSAMSWKVKDKFARVDMVAISTSERTVYNRWYDDYETWAPPDDKEWADLGPNVGSAVAMCTPYTYRLDLWTTDQESRNITHTYWNQKSDDDISDAGKDGQTGANGVFFFAGREWDPQPLKPSRSAPAVACRDSKVYHDILFYADDDNALYHASFDNDNGWQTSSAWNGDWVGDPTIFAPSDDPERWEFFGVQGNDEMYHLTWTSGSDGGYSSLTRLGGSIISVPSVVSLDKGVYDVLALGTNGTVQHRHYDGTGWSTDWEDLGVRAHSAPNVGVQGDTVFVAAVTQDNKLKVWSRDNSVKESWKGSLKEEDLGGDLSLDFFTDDS